MLRDISLRMMIICGIKKKNTADKNKHVDMGEKIGVARKEEKWGEGKMGKRLILW